MKYETGVYLNVIKRTIKLFPFIYLMDRHSAEDVAFGLYLQISQQLCVAVIMSLKNNLKKPFWFEPLSKYEFQNRRSNRERFKIL